MARVNMLTALRAHIILLLAVGTVTAQELKPTQGTNLARGKALRFDPPPSYPGCTDPGDTLDLTDGRYNGCLWIKKGTVGFLPGYGWDIETTPVLLVDMDLGEERPIREVTFSSITGSGGVTFPFAVRVFVSTDARNYDLLCDIPTSSVPQDKPLNHRFAAGGLKGWGRHVRIAVLPGGPMVFFDEIEIMAGSHSRDEAQRLNKRPIPAGMVKIFARQMRRGTPTLWTYSGYGSDRGTMRENGSYPCEGLLGLKIRHPEFHRVATAINSLLIRKSFLDEQLRSVERANFYARSWSVNTTHIGTLARNAADLLARSADVDARLNDLFQLYGAAFDADRSPRKLMGATPLIDDLQERLQRIELAADDLAANATAAVAEPAGPWKTRSLALKPQEKWLDKNGTSRRYQFTAFHGAHLAPLWPLGPFDGYHIDHPIPWPVSDTPGTYAFPKLRGYMDRIIKESSGRITSFSMTEPSYRGDVIPMTDWMLAKAKADPDLLLQTEEGQAPPLIASTLIGNNSRLNVHNPAAIEYVRGYLKNLASELSRQTDVNYFMTAWEGSAGHVGYNPSSQAAFREYLAERYGSIKTLNRRWQSDHPSFQAIGIPYRQYTDPAPQVTGLTYEFERWRRVNYVRFIAKMRSFLKQGAPGVPVMSDPSHFLREGNTYLMYREQACDIMSFHSYPALEDPMWVYLETMNRTFGRTAGYFENYFGMWSRQHLSNERLAKRDLHRFFFKMFLRDVRVSNWWLGFHSHPTSYVTAYNGNAFGLNYDQTILRWSTTALPVMFRRCRSMERALLESRQEVPKTAIIQPCASVFNLASMKPGSNDSPSLTLMFDIHNKLLAPQNIAHDYLPEEMIQDGRGQLEDYTVLCLPFAPYVSRDVSRRLVKWVKNGGTLVAFGPFALKDEFGLELAVEDSVFRTLFPDFRELGPGVWNYSTDGSANSSQPVIASRLGQGRVICLNRPLEKLMADASLSRLLNRVLQDSCEQTASSPDRDLEILVREGKRGEKYLGLCNRNVEQPIETIVTIDGRHKNLVDLLVPGWCPVPSHILGRKTILRIRLGPGDWTLLRL